jgi:hypothetical protein
MSDDPQLDYASSQVRQGATGRSLRTWGVLCLVWLVGLVVWAVYLVAILYLALKVL